MKTLIGLIASATLAFSIAAEAQGNSIFEASYEVTITNLTHAQSFTPLIVATHRPGTRLFELGAEPSQALADMAEGGDTTGLTLELENSGAAFDIEYTDGGLIGPGESRTVVVDASLRGYNQLSLAGMLLPTNDNFMAVNAMPLEFRQQTSVFVPAYDAGSEDNDEDCDNIPGPLAACGGGEAFSDGLGEGFIHVSRGIRGVGELDPAIYDWHNPVAIVKVVRVY